MRRGSESIIASAELYEQLLANHNSAARRLGPWEGKVVRVERERPTSTYGRYWPQTSNVMKLLRVDAIGIVLQPGIAPKKDVDPVVADWSRVKLQPDDLTGQPPLIRVSLG